jgi:hypothetical protein
VKDRIKKSLLSITGSNLKVSESKKSISRKKKQRFIKLVNHLKDINTRASILENDYGINLFYYEDAHYQLFEELLEEIYGRDVSQVIFWWVYDVDDPKNKEYKVKDEKTNEEHTIRTTPQLYTIIKKLKLFKEE